MSDKEQHEANQDSAAGLTPSPSPSDDDGAPGITLDRYFSRRRPPRSIWGHIVALIGMIVALVLLIAFKDRCSVGVSQMVEQLTQPPPPASH